MLLVEDNQLNAEIAAELLRMSALTFDCAWDGIEAVDCLANCPDGYYNMVFMDIQMPRMNGYDATRAIRSSARDYCSHLDPFGIVIPSTHFKSIIVNSPNHHAKECAND